MKVYLLKHLYDLRSGRPECDVAAYGTLDRAKDALLARVDAQLAAEVKHVLGDPNESILEYEFEETGADYDEEGAIVDTVWTIEEQEVL